MTQEEKLIEDYLNRFEQELHALSALKRAELVLELRNQIKDLAGDPSQIRITLLKMGPAEEVARLQLQKRGIAPSPKRPMRKGVKRFFVFGSLGFFFLLLLGGWLVTRKIQNFLNHAQFEWKTGTGSSSSLFGQFSLLGDLVGSKVLDPQKTPILFVQLNNTQLDLSSSQGGRLFWACQPPTDPGGRVKKIDLTHKRFHLSSPHPTEGEKTPTGKSSPHTDSENQAVLDLSDLGKTRCQLQVPEEVQLLVRGRSAEIKIDQPQGPMDVELDEGRVGIRPDENQTYAWDVRVRSGTTQGFRKSSPGSSDLKIRVQLKKGSIQKFEE